MSDYSDSASAVTSSDETKCDVKKDDIDVSTWVDNMDQEDILDDETFISQQVQAGNRKKKKSGGFQSMGLCHAVFKAILHKGFKVPTPIQRKTIPLIMEGNDVVGMARTGSGKTAAFLIPMIEKLKTHSAKVGARVVILSPSRELAIQTQRVCKELAKYTDLRTCVIVGGDGLDEQFAMIANNPDILIATPGRLLHLIVEMDLDMKTVEYVVFDEADRLFEMGFSVQLHEILSRLPQNRQTMLFSATMPRGLYEFAKAGLQEPKLVRLDVDTKISSDLEMAFFSVKQPEKEAALLYILREIIKVPLSLPSSEAKSDDDKPATEGKRKKKKSQISQYAVFPHQTLIFVSTKHHVEYISALVSLAGYQCSYVYGTLDQTARKIQINNFRNGKTNLLVVTDVAARGIDIPILENVINYDFVDSSKMFVHRVGRTARAGRRGWAYSLITSDELPYVLDLQLFLGRRLLVGSTSSSYQDYSSDIILGCFPPDTLDIDMEWVKSKVLNENDLASLQKVAKNGYKLYTKSRSSASSESHTRSKQLYTTNLTLNIHPIFAEQVDEQEKNFLNFITSISNFRPSETIFEIGKRGINKQSSAAHIMKKRRSAVGKLIEDYKASKKEVPDVNQTAVTKSQETLTMISDISEMEDSQESNKRKSVGKSELKAKKRKVTSFKDDEYYIPHVQKDANTEKGYSITQGSSFAEQAQRAILDSQGDEHSLLLKTNALRWDSKKKNFVRGIGTDNKKLITTESGTKIPATYKSGRFKEWQKQNKISIPATGEKEIPGSHLQAKRYRHNKITAPKPPDPLSINYEKKKKTLQKMDTGNTLGKVTDDKFKTELKTIDQISKERRMKAKKKAKNARLPRKLRKK